MDRAVAKVVANYFGPKSKCTCGHTGDGQLSCHEGPLGHGKCKECDCGKFTWKSFLPGFATHLKKHKIM